MAESCAIVCAIDNYSPNIVQITTRRPPCQSSVIVEVNKNTRIRTTREMNARQAQTSACTDQLRILINCSYPLWLDHGTVCLITLSMNVITKNSDLLMKQVFFLFTVSQLVNLMYFFTDCLFIWWYTVSELVYLTYNFMNELTRLMNANIFNIVPPLCNTS